MEIRPEVEKGAALLDEVEPDWWMRIDPATLHMQSAQFCIVGQLYRDDWYGLHKAMEAGTKPQALGDFDRQYGFNLPRRPHDPPLWEWNQLRDEWVAAAKLRANAQ